MMFSQGLQLFVQIGSIVILARLLSPADFGVVTMVTTFSLLFTNVGLNGITEAIIQRADLPEALASNLFWMNVGVGVLLTGAFAASGSLLARFYGVPLVAHVAAGVSPSILLSGTSVVHLALLKRGLRFTRIAANDLAARAVSVSTSIALGWAGWGYWALVAGIVSQALSTSVGAWILCRWLPGLPRRVPGVGSMMRFAIHVYGFFALNYTKGNIDNLLVAWNFGPAILGVYKKAYDLFCLPGSLLLSPVATAAVAALSRLNHEPEKLRKYVLHAFQVLAFVGMGVGACLTLAGKDLVLVLLGPKWEEAGRVFTFFGPGIGGMFLYAPWGWMTLSIGRAERYSRWGIVELTVTGLLFLLGLQWGPAGVAAAWSVSYWILVFPATWYAGIPIRFEIGPAIQVIWRYVVAAILAACITAVIIQEIPSLQSIPGTIGSIIRLLTKCSLVSALYVGVAGLLHGGKSPIYLITRLLKDLAPFNIGSNRLLNFAQNK
jgi:O-antigen/teichoic acid export membrane protein